ncbi:MAG: hypothetical protein M1832_000499 [Thelocarpon impressellum]|nr:MAG: hypothetical protein M1832_000499 [Thelocarpon impressellum]
MVSLGAHLRFWSYSSSAADQYASRKRRLRRSARGSNANGDRFSGTGRGALEDYITNEKVELEREKEKNRREANRLASRFGIGLLGPGASEAELLEYARMLSEETFAQDEERRRSGSEDVSGGSLDGRSSETVTPEGSTTGPPSPALAAERGVDSDVAEAIRLSLEVNSVPGKRGQSCGIPFKYVQGRRSPSSSPPRETLASKVDNDLDFALQLSLAEEQSRKAAEAEAEMFPELSEAQPKGNGKRRAS